MAISHPWDPRSLRAPLSLSEASINLIDSPYERNSWCRLPVEVHSRCSSQKGSLPVSLGVEEFEEGV